MLAAPSGSPVVRKQQARTQFETAGRMRDALNGRPASERTRKDYQKVADAYRKVYYISPASSKADASVMVVAEILAEMGRQFAPDARDLHAAIDQYEFLRRKYPGSEYRVEALFTIGQIYKEDLGDEAAAKATFEKFLKRYPHNQLAPKAQEALAELNQVQANKKTEFATKSDLAPDAAAVETPKKGGTTRVTGIRYWLTADYTRVAIDLDSEAKYESGRVPDPDRIFFDLQNTKLVSTLVGKSFDVQDGLLKKIRVAQHTRDSSRVVLEVDNLAEYSVFLLPNPHRLVVDIHGKNGHETSQMAVAPPAAVPPETSSATSPATTETPPSATTSATAKSTRKTATVSTNAVPDKLAKPEQKAETLPVGAGASTVKPQTAAKPDLAATKTPTRPATTETPLSATTSAIGKSTSKTATVSPNVLPDKLAKPEQKAETLPVGADASTVKPQTAAKPDLAATKTPSEPAAATTTTAFKSASGELVAADALSPRPEPPKPATKLESTAPPPPISSDDADSNPANRGVVAAPPVAPPIPDTNTKKGGNKKSARNTTTAAQPVHAAAPTSEGDRSLVRALGLKIGTIVVDAGHGGHDTGTIGPNGLMEKDLVLDVALRLGKLLESRLGANVIYTRDDDTFIPLETRTAIANERRADMFISVHANSSRDASARGVETYYLNFTTNANALEVAARENAVSEKSVYELQDLVKKITLKDKIEESKELASDVQQSLYAGLSPKSPTLRNRGVKKAPFVVLIGANMPSILAEISFVSNPTDEKKLQTPEYCQKIAESLFKGIAKYAEGLSGVKVATKTDKDAGK